jgi:uncharacterized protein YciI
VTDPIRRRRALAAFAIVPILGTMLAFASPTARAQQASPPMQDIRFVVFHRPGPAWIPGKTLFEQSGVREHVGHYRQWLENGKLEMGGPHLDAGGGGMMIPVAGVGEDEARRFAAADPAVASGVLVFDVRPWLVGMHK